MALAPGAAAPRAADARYDIRLVQHDPPRFEVTAQIEANEPLLRTDNTWPGNLDKMASEGWPALITGLTVTDSHGQAIAWTLAKPGNFRLERKAAGPLTLRYVVDGTLLAENHFPAPCEAMFVDADHLSVIARALFITSDAVGAAVVTFRMPEGFDVVAPWPQRKAKDGSKEFLPASAKRLMGNAIVFTRTEAPIVTAAGFRLTFVPMGAWGGFGSDIASVLRAHTRRYVERTGFRGSEDFLVALIPLIDEGAESYPQSLALTLRDAPDKTDRAAWGNILGHEVFHYWNGWRLKGADYQRTQWLQEGFTEYEANLSSAASGVYSKDALLAQLGRHVANYRKLTTTLEETGGRKGPPLYGAGALVAFDWDTRIRAATDGRKSLAAFWKALDRRCNEGADPYDRDDIIAALNAASPADWASYLDTYVRGKTPLPLQEMFARAGLTLSESADGTTVAEDPAASKQARKLWDALAR